MARYCFAGHESFHCKALWLKKGYDFILDNNCFNAPDAVIKLGVGKNMVSAIRYWLRSFGMIRNDKITPIADYLFNDENGKDKFTEDINTLWLLHYHLIKSDYASIYHLIFLDFQREHKEFDKDQLLQFIKRKCNVPEQKNVYNENSVKKDIRVFLQNYVMPTSLNVLEEFSSLLINLRLIQSMSSKMYCFTETKETSIDPTIILYSLIDIKQNDKTISYDKLQELSLLFCLPMPKLIEIIRKIVEIYPTIISYSDNSGIKNVQFLGEIDKFVVLDNYYLK